MSRTPDLLIQRMVTEGIPGVQADRIIGFSGNTSFAQSAFFDATRRALAQGKDEPLISLEGREALVGKDDHTPAIKIKREGDEFLTIRFPELGLFSSDPAERLRAFSLFLSELGVTAPNFSELQQAAKERELSNKEVSTLMLARSEGINNFRTRIYSKLMIGSAKLHDLVPDSLTYFELFCGPEPTDLAPKEYLSTILPAYRKALLRRDLRQGLEICLMGALHDDLCPSPWLADIDDNELWNNLQDCQPENDPFSLLAALDLALGRDHDSRFREFSERAVTRLTAKEFLNSDGVDLYSLMPMLSAYTMSRLHKVENGALRPPFWRRMCAWMQAGLVSRFLDGHKIKPEQIQELVKEHRYVEDIYSQFLDLRREPMFAAGEISDLALRREVLGRLLNIRERYLGKGIKLPNDAEVERTKHEFLKTGPRAWPFLPGPLDGANRPEDLGHNLPEENKKFSLELSGDQLVAALTNFSQVFHFDEESRASLSNAVAITQPDGEGSDLEKFLSKLLNASLIAAAERDPALAQDIADSLQSRAPELKGESQISQGLEILLSAGAAVPDEQSWSAWLEEQLAQFAFRLPIREASSILWHQIQVLKTLNKVGLRTFNRAEAIASAAAF